MNKVYVVKTHWADDGETSDVWTDGIVGVYSTLEKAKAKFNQVLADEKKEGFRFDTEDESNCDTYFCIYNDGYFDRDHYIIQIVEAKLDE